MAEPSRPAFLRVLGWGMPNIMMDMRPFKAHVFALLEGANDGYCIHPPQRDRLAEKVAAAVREFDVALDNPEEYGYRVAFLASVNKSRAKALVGCFDDSSLSKFGEKVLCVAKLAAVITGGLGIAGAVASFVFFLQGLLG